MTTTVVLIAAAVGVLWLLSGWLTGGEKRVLHDIEIRAVDGDTLDVEGVEETVRLSRVDTPEKGEPGAAEATRFVRRQLEEADHVKVVSFERGKYGRHVAEVEVDGRNLSDMLLEKGLAEPY